MFFAHSRENKKIDEKPQLTQNLMTASKNNNVSNFL